MSPRDVEQSSSSKLESSRLSWLPSDIGMSYITVEWFGVAQSGQNHGKEEESASSLYSAVIIPTHDLCINQSQVLQATARTPKSTTSSVQTPQGNLEEPLDSIVLYQVTQTSTHGLVTFDKFTPVW